MLNILADNESAGAGLAGIIGILWLVGIVYAIVCFFVPFMVGAIMHNTKRIEESLRRIEKLLEAQKLVVKAEPEKLR